MTEGERPRAGHRPFGSDRVEPSSDGGVWLICRESTGWLPRRGRAHTAGEFPGTAVRWESDVFEVVEALAGADGTQRYRLEPWPDRHAIRRIQEYDATSRDRRSQERAGYRKSVAKRRLSILFAPILGHLPGPVQARMESEFGAPAFGETAGHRIADPADWRSRPRPLRPQSAPPSCSLIAHRPVAGFQKQRS